MRVSELLRLVWINLSQNKFKVILTSIGIVAGTATIMMVIAIGSGGQKEVAEQFKNLNAGAIDITGEEESEQSDRGRGPGGMSGGAMPAGGMPMGTMPNGGFMEPGSQRQEAVSLTESDMEDLAVFVPGISDTTISYTAKSDVNGGDLEESESYSIAGVKENYKILSNMELSIGDFFTTENEENKEKVCILGSIAAKEIFGSDYNAYNGTLYIDSRPYVICGVLEEMGTVASGISPDSTVFIPYATGIKYLTGDDVNPTITVIAEDVDEVSNVKANITTVLQDSYANTEFTITDAGSKMDAAMASNDILTMLLAAMAIIVFIVGGIGIMNVLFVSVKERTNEIGILKALGCSRRDILVEFLCEAGCISLVGAILGVILSLGITPVIEGLSVRVELSVPGTVISLMFGVFTGSVFGFYPAYKASSLIPVEALNQE